MEVSVYCQVWSVVSTHVSELFRNIEEFTLFAKRHSHKSLQKQIYLQLSMCLNLIIERNGKHELHKNVLEFTGRLLTSYSYIQH